MRKRGCNAKVVLVLPTSPHRLVGLGHRPFTAVTGVRIPLGTPNQMRTLTALTLGMLWTSDVSATTIIAIFDNREAVQRIVISADGLQSLTDESGHRLGEKRVCKINSAGPFLFAIAGVASSPNGSYEPYQLIRRELLAPGDFQKHVANIEQIIISQASVARPPDVNQLVAEVLIVDTIHFPQYYMGKLLRADDGYRFDSTGIRTALTGNIRVVILGIRDHASAKLNESPEILDDSVSAVRTLIQTEIATHPTGVGLPMSIVEARRSGVTWIEKGACVAEAEIPK
jgi:hypothetical protein